MADVISLTRTNYFTPSDPDKLKNLIQSLKTDAGPATLVFDGGHPGKAMFYAPGDFLGVLSEKAEKSIQADPEFDPDDEPDENYDMNRFLARLQACVAPGDACVILSIGHEKMRSLWADGMVVTCDNIKPVSMRNTLRDAARGLLNDPGWGEDLEI